MNHDLRITWPERQIATSALMRRHPAAWSRRYGEVMLPDLPRFLELTGGVMPPNLEELHRTKFADQLLNFWNDAIKRGMPFRAAELQAKSDSRWAFQTEWWQYEGHRIYALDATTAHALLNTEFEDFPTDQFHLPVNSFFIRFPRELQWMIDLNDTPVSPELAMRNEALRTKYHPDQTVNGVTLHAAVEKVGETVLRMDPERSEISHPLGSHLEPTQPIDGVMVTGETFGDGKLKRLSLVIAGESKLDQMADHMLWIELGFDHETLGGVLHQLLEAAEPEGADDLSRLFELKLLKLTLGTILYIGSAHPQLQAIAPPSVISIRKGLRDPDARKRARARSRSRYTTVYVGGPQQGFQAQDEAPLEGLARRPPTPHMRAGHMRHVWVGGKGAMAALTRHSEVRWIQPVMVGSWDRIAAWEALKGARLVMRKTRPAEVIGP